MAEEKRGLLSFLGAGRSITITTGEGDAGSGRVDPPPAGGTLVDTAYLTTLVGQGRITLTQKAQVLNGTLTPEQLVALNIISSNEFAALTGQVYAGASVAVAAAVAWTSTLSASDGQLVTFNGSLYQAVGTPAAGTIPPVEIAAPANTQLGARYRLLSRGRSDVVAWDSTAQYYRDQVVTYLGGRYRCESAGATKGTAPCIDSTEWVTEHQGMTSREQTQIPLQTATPAAASTNISTVTANLTNARVEQGITGTTQDIPRVRRFHINMLNGGTAVAAAGTLLTFTFAQPFPATNKTPAIRCTPLSALTAARAITAIPAINGLGQCIGFTLVNGLATVAADPLSVMIEIEEHLGQN